MAGYTETEKQTEILNTLNREIEEARKDLIDNMKRLAWRLTDEVARLEADPERRPSSVGYVASTSLSYEIDHAAVRADALVGARAKVRAIKDIARKAAARVREHGRVDTSQAS